MGYVEYVTAIAELSRVDGSVGIIVAAHTSLCSNHIFLAGNEAQKKKYVSKLATGEFIGAWGLTEPSSGSDAGSGANDAVRKGNSWVLNGTKNFLHQRPLRRCDCGAGGDRPSGAHPRLSASSSTKKTRDFVPARKKISSACEPRHGGVDFRRLRHPRGKPAWRRRPGISRRYACSSMGGRISIAALSLGMAEGAL